MTDAPIFEAWGRVSVTPRRVISPESAEGICPPPEPYLAYGNGRSYGDSCLPHDGVLIAMRGPRNILFWHPEVGVLRAEAGVLLAEVLDRVVPDGWFLPVLPGTRFVTLGGALANDIHGKNHHGAGTFGVHVRAFELVRSDGSRRVCSRAENADWFAATIGGMGLTGVVSWIELQLVQVTSPWIMQEALPLASLDQFFELAATSDRDFAYSVAWIDSLATGANLGRGVFFRGNHATAPEAKDKPEFLPEEPFSLPFPIDPPFALINRLSLTVFNALYRWSALRGARRRLVDYRSFFFPLDRVRNWNRAYGPKGLRQFQCVLPLKTARATVEALLAAALEARHASFLTVLKIFGDVPSPGLISFPRKGATLTLDFPYKGEATDRLLAELDAITLGVGGAVNPYKDARMSADVFAASFPDWRRIVPYLDPHARSGFSVRVGLQATAALPEEIP
jgi:FAD/FMN-containing dehydrogenase